MNVFLPLDARDEEKFSIVSEFSSSRLIVKYLSISHLVANYNQNVPRGN
jgi:hypothetical protein